MKVTTKGQVTVPRAIRERTGILSHTDVEFIMRGKEVILRKLSGGRRGNALIAQMRGGAGTGLSTDEIMKLTKPRRDASMVRSATDKADGYAKFPRAAVFPGNTATAEAHHGPDESQDENQFLGPL